MRDQHIVYMITTCVRQASCSDVLHYSRCIIFRLRSKIPARFPRARTLCSVDRAMPCRGERRGYPSFHECFPKYDQTVSTVPTPTNCICQYVLAVQHATVDFTKAGYS